MCPILADGRHLWFHSNAFTGLESEINDLRAVVARLVPLDNPRHVDLSFGDGGGDSRRETEKVLHRLVVIGVVSDYTIDYSRREFGVQVSGAAA